MEEEFLFFTSFLFPGTKKALQMDLESLLTHQALTRILMALERAARPSGCSRPGTPTRQSLVPGFFICFSTNYRILSEFIFHLPIPTNS